MTRRIISIAALALFAAATVWINYEVKVNLQPGHHGSVHQLGGIRLGRPAPDFSLLDLSNRTVSLASYRGRKVILLDFWATWCAPCRMEMVDLQSLLAIPPQGGLLKAGCPCRRFRWRRGQRWQSSGDYGPSGHCTLN
jgi:AhpC/TSA family